jgi:hypothetical protein
VGSEFACMCRYLGVAVTVLDYVPVVVPLDDRYVSREFERCFRRRRIPVMTEARFGPAGCASQPGRHPPRGGPGGWPYRGSRGRSDIRLRNNIGEGSMSLSTTAIGSTGPKTLVDDCRVIEESVVGCAGLHH